MAGQTLSAIYGLPGTGKSYQFVKFHAIPALKRRQVVATNLKGFFDPGKQQHLADYLGMPLDELQALCVRLPDRAEDLFQPNHWPDTLKWETGEPQSTTIPAGCLLGIDECSTIFARQPPEYVMRYLTEQRHGVDAHGNTGLTVLMTQTPNMHASVRSLLEIVYRLSDYGGLGPFMSALGRDYRLEVLTDPRRRGWDNGKALSNTPERYDRKIFAFYKSNSADHANTKKRRDFRTTLLASKGLWAMLALLAAGGYFGGGYVWDRFGAVFADKPAVAAPSGVPAAAAAPAQLSPNSAFATAPAVRPGGVLIGSYTLPTGLPVYLIKSGDGSYTYYAAFDVAVANPGTPFMYLILPDGSRVRPAHGGSDAKSKTAAAGLVPSAVSPASPL